MQKKPPKQSMALSLLHTTNAIVQQLSAVNYVNRISIMIYNTPNIRRIESHFTKVTEKKVI